MSEYDNRNRFVLFKNTRQREGSKDPDYTGSFTDANGVEHFADAWLQTSSKGNKFLSGRVKPKQEKQGGQDRRESPAPFDDDGPPF